MNMTTADILRDHALYHKTAEYWDLPDTEEGNDAWMAIGFDALLCNSSALIDEPVRRMFLLFVAESLED